MSKRMGASFCTEVLGVPLAVGEVCQVEQPVAAAVEPPGQEARGFVQGEHANVDESSWRQQQRRAWLWVVVTQWGSVFYIGSSRGAQVLGELLGVGDRAVLTSDRAKAYNRPPLRGRRLCGAPLRRDFQALIDRGGGGAVVGESRLEHAEVLFAWWHRVREGTWSWATFPCYMRWLRASWRAELEAGRRCACPKTAATCQELLAHEAALWTFVRIPGLDPPNHAAERALRHVVQWRKTS